MISFFVRVLRVKKIYAALFLFVFASSSLGQGGGLESGAIIVLSSNGLVEVTDPKGTIITKTLNPGTVLTEGFTIRTGLTGEMSALFSNGMTATLERQSSLKISTFLQAPFRGDNQTIDQTEDELSSTTLFLSMDMGSLIVESKKLNKDSSFQIQTSVGTAGIRGTEFQLSQQKGGTCKLDVASSAVSFIPANNPQPTLIAEGQGMDASPDGTIQTRPIDPVAKINISNKNQAAAQIASKISLAVLKEAAGKAKSIAPNSSGSNGTDSESQKNATPSPENEKSEEDKEGSSDKDMRDSFLKQSNLNLRSVGGAEVIAQTKGKVSFSIDPETGRILVNQLDAFGNVISSSEASSEQISKFLEDPTALIEAITINVFKEQVNLGFKYEKGINYAIAEAVKIAKSFLTNINLSNSLPAANTWNASELAAQFADNPYAYEFGLILTRYGAFGENSADTPDQSITKIGTNILDLLGGRAALKNNDFIKKSIITASPVIGNSYTSTKLDADENVISDDSKITVLDGNILGTRAINLGKEKRDNFDLEVDRVIGLVGSTITIADGAELDPSLSEGANAMNQVFAISAAKDIIIEGDLDVKNSKNFDQAVALGAADDIHFRSKNMYDYFNEDFADMYLNEKITYKNGTIDEDNTDSIFVSDKSLPKLITKEDHKKLSITNHGSDFGIGTYDKLELIDLDISTKGNLALGSLDELKILSTRFDESVEFSDNNIKNVLDLNKLSAGTTGSHENQVYLYAHNRIAVNGLGFGQNVREIYMDAITIDLKNVKFPNTSQVHLKSKIGIPTFGTNAREIGKVNFIKNVYHGKDAVNQGFFSKDVTNRNSNKQVGQIPAIQISAH